MTTPLLPPVPTMLRAFRRKDPAFDGTFVVAVKTTGVFCRPVCRAKPARAENLEFFTSPAEAVRQGYRACKLCRPLDHPGATPAPVSRLIALLDTPSGTPLRENDLRQLGIEPATARRQFRAHCGMTFSAYQRARRLGAALDTVRAGAPAVDAMAQAGFESASGFRGALRRFTGATAGATTRSVAAPEPLRRLDLSTPLGRMTALARDAGVVLLDFADRRGLADDVSRLRRDCGAAGRDAVVVPGEHPHLQLLARELRSYFHGTLRQFTTPLDIRGTPFQRRAWEYLRTIPYGRTRTYGEQAAAIGRPGAARAVGRANGSNLLCILVPCHRVVGASGDLTGYAGGTARKCWLLRHEASVSRHAR